MATGDHKQGFAHGTRKVLTHLPMYGIYSIGASSSFPFSSRALLTLNETRKDATVMKMKSSARYFPAQALSMHANRY